MEAADFGGWATKAGIKCSDGRTIMPNAFAHMDKMQVPLVWQHGHSDVGNVLGHAILENRTDGVYAYAFFNGTKQGQNAKQMVEHGDIKSLSIYANNLVEKSKQVIHGMIREVSLVLAGANPGAVIDFVRIAHSDGSIDDLDDEAVIHTGLTLEHDLGDEDEEDEEDDLEHEDNETIQDVFDTLTDKQKDLVGLMVEKALESVVAQSAIKNDPPAEGDAKPGDQGEITHQEGADDMSRNVFDQTGAKGAEKNTLSHADVQGIVASAMKVGSLKQAVQDYALEHGIDNIEALFPDAKAIGMPEFNKRRTEWVPGVLNAVRHTPFSRIKTISADLTQEEARAKGYIKGTYKKEEWFGVTRRTTTPTTVYKKQQLDRDDIVDITDFDVVAWVRAEMRMMLEEELARAILIGDGRDVASQDKIRDPAGASDGAGIRSIVNDNELYVTTVNVNVDDANSDYLEVVEAFLRARRFYKGTGTPSFYGTNAVITNMLLTKDAQGRRYWNNLTELAGALMVKEIVEVEVMEDVPDVLGIVVNLADYNIGADKGGEVSLFDDFDIDYNLYKYLIETRVSGALTKIKSALLLKKVAASSILVDPVTEPTFNMTTGVVTIPTQTNVVYKNADTGATLTAGAQTALAPGAHLNVVATPTAGHYFASSAEDNWTFTREHAKRP